MSGADPLSVGLASPQEILAQTPATTWSSTAHTAEAAKKFEGMLMENLFRLMRKTVEPSGLFGKNDNARSTYEYLLDQAVTSNALDAGKGMGLASRLEAAWTPKAVRDSLANGNKDDSPQ